MDYQQIFDVDLIASSHVTQAAIFDLYDRLITGMNDNSGICIIKTNTILLVGTSNKGSGLDMCEKTLKNITEGL
ncbi:hypothetical protein BDC45DRAFT_604516 [Circinella umbellata]|nr:hypothetical protein BDC45DRAFT_604516 [Circinella umbellata]